MKTLIIILLLPFGVNAYSQTTNDDLFAGTWRWVSGTDTMTIVIEKQNLAILNPSNPEPTLVGWHRYVKNGIVVESSFQYLGRDASLDKDSTYIDNKVTLFGFAQNNTSARFVNFWNLTYHRSDELYLTFLPNSTTQVTWKIRGHAGIMHGLPKDRHKYSMPINLVLTKL
jgi:hypothetical protein